MEGLAPEQQAQLDMFNEVTANSREASSSVQLLQACNWNVEQALALHWSAGDDAAGAASARSAPSTAAGDLGTPLLAPDGGDMQVDVDRSGGALGTLSGLLRRTGIFGRTVQGVWRFGSAVVNILFSFVFGGANVWLNNGATSGGLLRGDLVAQYGPQLQFPTFFEGGFAEALQTARRDAKLLAVYLHSEHARHSQSFCRDVLTNEFVREMLDENFVVWGGDIARMETHQVAQMIQARQFPSFSVLLPASMDEIRVIGSLSGEVQVDSAVALLTSCTQEMDMHRSEVVAQREQHNEDRSLREDQDKEYEEALEMDRKRSEDAKLEAERQQEAARVAEEERRKVEEEEQRAEAERVESEERKKRKASALEPPGPDAKARVSIRLPAGQRVERKFVNEATLADVYAWADCLPYLPENTDKGLVVPDRFMLKTTFPARDLTEMDRSIQELQLNGAMVLLAEIEDDD